MGYPTAYRTGAARQMRQLSREPASVPNPVPQDNRPFPRKPANENWPKQASPWKAPPSIPRNVWRNIPAPLRQTIKLGMVVHPWLRILSGLWKLYDLYDWLKRVRTGTGDYTLACDAGFAAGCTSPMPCCGNCYCGGPIFQNAINNPALCGLAGQAGPPSGPGYFQANRYFDGQIIWAIRGASSPPAFCHPARMVAQWRLAPGAWAPTPGMLRAPYVVPWVRTYPAPHAPHRWLRPDIRMLPGDPVEVTPAPPPYPMIPNRPDMWPGARGNDVGVEQLPDTGSFAYRSPPRSGEREKKVKWSGAQNLMNAILVSISRVHGKLADLRDILGAMDDALPKELRLKGKDKKSIPKLLDNVYRNLDKMDGEKALAGIIKEIAEDVVGGVGDRFRSEAAQNFGWLKNKVYTSPRF